MEEYDDEDIRKARSKRNLIDQWLKVPQGLLDGFTVVFGLLGENLTPGLGNIVSGIFGGIDSIGGSTTISNVNASLVIIHVPYQADDVLDIIMG